MADTFIKIARVDVGAGGATTFDFTSIPSTYTDLCLKISCRTSNATTAEVANISFNGSSSSISVRFIYGSGSSATSATSTSYAIWTGGANATANTFGNAEMYFPNYAGSSNKSWSADSVSENNATEAYANLFAGLWSNTSAINRITLTAGAGSNFAQYSSATLYGILKA